jgi:SOS response regulatory protein OraA/RecX
LNKKSGQITEKNTMIRKSKLAKYLVGKGYEPELVWEMMNKFS